MVLGSLRAVLWHWRGRRTIGLEMVGNNQRRASSRSARSLENRWFVLMIAAATVGGDS